MHSRTMQTDDPLLTCPYNKGHMVLKSRIQAHIIKCQKKHATGSKMMCPFNATHHVDKSDYQYHVSTCPDRRVIEQHKYETTETLRVDLNCIPSHQLLLPPSEEDWDTVPSVAVNRPAKHLDIACLTKTQKKAKRLRERQRKQNVENRKILASSTTTTSEAYMNSHAINNLFPASQSKRTSDALFLYDENMGLGRGCGRPAKERTPGKKHKTLVIGYGRGIPLNAEPGPVIVMARGKRPSIRNN